MRGRRKPISEIGGASHRRKVRHQRGGVAIEGAASSSAVSPSPSLAQPNVEPRLRHRHTAIGSAAT